MSRYEGYEVLILEDEILIAAQLEEFVTEIGCRPRVAYSVAEALRLIDLQKFDIALLDMSLDEELSLPVAEALKQRLTPFAVMTGHQPENVGEFFGDVPILGKPFAENEGVVMLGRLRSLPTQPTQR